METEYPEYSSRSHGGRTISVYLDIECDCQVVGSLKGKAKLEARTLRGLQDATNVGKIDNLDIED